MRLGVTRTIAWALATCCVGAAAVPAASARERAPVLLQGSYVGNYFEARPALMSFYSPVARTFTSYVTGPGITRSQYDHGRTGSIRWTRWDGGVAVGRGEQWEDDCQPSCARGTFEPTPVSLRAWRGRHGRYTRLELTLHPRGLRPLSLRYSLLLTGRRFAGDRIFYWGTRTTVADIRTLVSAHAARPLPTLLTGWYGRYAVRPSSIYYTGDGSGVAGVLRGGGGERGRGRGFLRWTRWGARGARGVGTVWIKLGTPTATSPFSRFAVTVDATRIRDGHLTRMTLHYRLGRTAVSDTRCVPDRGRVAEWGLLLDGRCD